MHDIQPFRKPRNAVSAALLIAGCGLFATTAWAEEAAEAAKEPPIRFEEVAKQAGIDFVHTTRSFGDRNKAQVLEMFTDGGSVVAVGDYNADGFDDLYLLDSEEGHPNLLMHNNGDGTFKDVAAEVGLAGGNGPETLVADSLWFDYDNDGHLDLLVPRMGPPVFYRNLGPDKDGKYRFEDVTEEAGLNRHANTVASVAFDYDRDGYLDLLLGHYFQAVNLFDLKTPNILPNNLDYADNGGGLSFWKNVPAKEGGKIVRRFVDATKEAGFDHHTGWSLDLGHADLDNDGWQDVYVASDYGTDRLFMNQKNGTFKDTTEEAIGWDTKKGMNVDMGDYDRNGYLDVYVTNITDEYMKECNMMWHNNGDGTFIDLSQETGTCDTDWGWAAKFGDYDNDGWEDLFVVNGLRSGDKERNYIPVLLEMILTPNVDFSDLNNYPDIEDMTWSGYQKQRLFHNNGGTFSEIAEEAGVGNDLDGRGVGVLDYNNDGLLDFYQGNASNHGLLFKGATKNAGNWLQLKLIGDPTGDKPSNRDAVGARVYVKAGDETYMREVNAGNGYSCQSTFRLHFGVADAKKIDSLEIHWPGGRKETISQMGGKPGIPVNKILRIEEGKGFIDS